MYRPSPRRERDDGRGGLPPELREFMRDLRTRLPPTDGETEDRVPEGWGISRQNILSRITRARGAITAAAQAFRQHMSPPPPPGGGPPGDIPPNVARMIRMHLERMEKKTDSLVNTVEQLVISVRSAVNSSVRNEIHMKRIEDSVVRIEANVEDALTSGKEAIDFYRQSNMLTEESYSSLKSTLDSVIKELKSSNKAKTPDAVEKTWVQKCDEALDNFDKVTKFPDRVKEQVNRVVRYAAAVEALLLWIGSSSYEEIKQVSCNLEDLKETCNDISLIDGTFCEIGKKASDLLYQFYLPGVTAIMSTNAADGSIINLPMKNGLAADVTFESKATLDSNHLEITLNVQDLYFPFAKGSLTVPLPWRSPEAHLHMLHDFGAIDAKVDLTSSPTLSLSCLFGVKAFSMGGDLAVNSSGVFIKYDAGVSITNKDFSVSLKLQDRFQQASASLFGKIGTVSFALEYVHNLSQNFSLEKGKEEKKKKEKERKPKHKIVAGVSTMVSQSTELKGFVDTDFVAGGAVHHHWTPSSSVALSCKVNLKSINKTPQFGLSLDFGLKSW